MEIDRDMEQGPLAVPCFSDFFLLYVKLKNKGFLVDIKLYKLDY